MEEKIPGWIAHLRTRINILTGIIVLMGIFGFLWIGAINVCLDTLKRSNEVWIEKQIKFEERMNRNLKDNYVSVYKIMPSCLKGGKTK